MHFCVSEFSILHFLFHIVDHHIRAKEKETPQPRVEEVVDVVGHRRISEV